MDDAASEENQQKEVAIGFAGAWVEATRLQARRYRDALGAVLDLHPTAESLSWDSREYEITAARDRVWTEAHLLVSAAYQLFKWGSSVTADDVEARPRPLELLTNLRNSTEHLDGATLSFVEARGSLGKAWSIEQLPGGRLSLRIPSDEKEPRVFDLLSVEAIERNAILWSEAVLYCQEPGLADAIDLQIDIAREK